MTSEQPTSDRSHRMRLAVVHTLMARPFNIAVMAIGVAILARFLTPTEFGVYALAFAVFQVAEQLCLFGLKPFLVRERKLSRLDLEHAVGLGLTTGLATFLFCIAGLMLLPDGAVPESFATVLLVLMASLLIQPMGLAAEVVLERDLRFGFVSALSVGRSITETGIGALLAVLGYGPIAIAIGFLAGRAVTAAGVLIFAPQGRVRPRLGGWKRFSAFGAPYALANTLPKLGGFALLAIFAELLGVATVGLFNRAQAIVTLLDRAVMNAIKPAIMPILARALEDGYSPGEVYVRKIQYLTSFLWPILVGMIVLTEPLIMTLLGPQWAEAVLPARLLLIGALTTPFTKMGLKLYATFDFTPVYLRIQTGFQVIRLLFAGIGATQSLAWACAGITIALFLKMTAVVWELHRRITYDTAELLGVLGQGLAIAAVAGGGASLGFLVPPETGPVAQLTVGLVGAGMGWLIALGVLRHPLIVDARSLLARLPFLGKADPAP
ncbi:oligosaccharide flippase family protein [Parvularcula lutaonensis]|uniref:Oligosaccharide flippase family protein n=1 Tax=Parvularcula lutaonensis TaxID=491923 RepID=A0ABV7MCG4_9PROT|nr:oligosaccharide flippase family protein [Parvularcula lutaonensis]GGY37980.1 lipopolysaccharide biosynthesis protein [Parvularcula lutaonensis]